MHYAHSSSRKDIQKWKKAYDDLYAPVDGILRQFRPASTVGREYVFIRKNVNEMITELHNMRKEADAAGNSPSVNIVNGSDYYALQLAIKSSADTAKTLDDKNTTKLKKSMKNVEV